MSGEDRRLAWQGLRQGLMRAVAFRGADRVADAIPADRSTVYRLLRRETPPTRAIEQGVRRVVERVNRSATP